MCPKTEAKMTIIRIHILIAGSGVPLCLLCGDTSNTFDDYEYSS